MIFNIVNSILQDHPFMYKSKRSFKLTLKRRFLVDFVFKVVYLLICKDIKMLFGNGF